MTVLVVVFGYHFNLRIESDAIRTTGIGCFDLERRCSHLASDGVPLTRVTTREISFLIDFSQILLGKWKELLMV